MSITLGQQAPLQGGSPMIRAGMPGTVAAPETQGFGLVMALVAPATVSAPPQTASSLLEPGGTGLELAPQEASQNIEPLAAKPDIGAFQGGLPWDALAAAAEEAGRLAMPFQYPPPQQAQNASLQANQVPISGLPLLSSATRLEAEPSRRSVVSEEAGQPAISSTPSQENGLGNLAPEQGVASAAPEVPHKPLPGVQPASTVSPGMGPAQPWPSSATASAKIAKAAAGVVEATSSAVDTEPTAPSFLPDPATAPLPRPVAGTIGAAVPALPAQAMAAASAIPSPMRADPAALSLSGVAGRSRSGEDLSDRLQHWPVVKARDATALASVAMIDQPDLASAATASMASILGTRSDPGLPSLAGSMQPQQKAAEPIVAVTGDSGMPDLAGLAVPAAPSPVAAQMSSVLPPLATAPAHRPQIAAEAAPQLVLRLAQASKDGVDRISVDLRPPELGRVEIQLTFRDNAVQVVMRAEQPETFEALRQDRQHLEQQLADAGLQLGAGGLDLQQGRLPRPQAEAPGSTAGDADLAEAPEETKESMADRRPIASDSLINIFV
ncbi:flagellar hook-length control protein FliK [Pseudoroseomonas globiformis]|uniref:Flagellar hook-length control protein FliK n=1 Tax=Teichococcus globiformis TaxID=2307229 RepID=A0ABV7G7C0_9PROT